MHLSLTQWVGLFILVCLIIQGTWGGYRRGPVRQLAGLIALIAAGLTGWLIGAPLGLALLGDSSVPWLLREPAGMMVLGLVVWLVALAWLWRAGRRPAGAEEAESPVLGAIVGCWTGLLNAAVILLLLVAWAGWTEMLSDESSRRHWAVETRDELAGMPGAEWLKGATPWPESWQRIVRKARRVLVSPEASRRLMEQEPIRALAAHPSFYTAWGDPEVKRLLREGRLADAMGHPKVRPLLNDEDFQRNLLKVNLEVSLDKALINQ